MCVKYIYFFKLFNFCCACVINVENIFPSNIQYSSTYKKMSLMCLISFASSVLQPLSHIKMPRFHSPPCVIFVCINLCLFWSFTNMCGKYTDGLYSIYFNLLERAKYKKRDSLFLLLGSSSINKTTHTHTQTDRL